MPEHNALPVYDFGGVIKSDGETLTSAASITLDMSGDPQKDLVLDTNATITVTNPTAGQLGVYVWIEQGATGGTAAWSGVDKWLNNAAPALATTAGDVDLILLTVRPNGTVMGEKIGTYS